MWKHVSEYENPLKSLGISETIIMIAGHTITSYYRSPEPGEHCKIFKNLDSQKILIDCGAKVLYNNKVYTLAMIRLDDLEEFYF